MTDDKDFQQRVKKIGGLVQELETIADPAARTTAKQLVQFLMDLHGTGLERILEIVFQSGEAGTRTIDELGRDPLVSSLLILYGLHPDDLQMRVERKLEQIRSKLYKMGAEAKLLSVSGNNVHLRVSVDRHACGSTSRTVRTILEEEIYNAAPDLASLAIEGMEEPAASGFVGVEKLLGSSPAVLPQPPLSQPELAASSNLAHSEGMD